MITHIVKRGDTLASIARQHGIKSWKDIYHHPQNAAFRLKRPNPNRIEVGDAILIPVAGNAAPTPRANGNTATPKPPQMFGPAAPSGLYPQVPPGFYDPKNHPELNHNPTGEITTYKAAIHANDFSTNYLGKLKPGDILFTTEEHWLSSVIKKVSGAPISHCNLYTKPNYLIDSAGNVTERYIPPHFEQNNFARAIAFQDTRLSAAQRTTILETARKFTDVQYDNMQLLAHGIATLSSRLPTHPVAFLPDQPRLAVKRLWVRTGLITLDFIDTFSPSETYARTFGDRKKLMCSSLVVFSYMNAGVKFNMTNADLIGSDDLYYYCRKNLKKMFDVVFTNDGIMPAPE